MSLAFQGLKLQSIKVLKHASSCYSTSLIVKMGESLIHILLLLQQSNLEAFKTAISAKVTDNQLVEVWLKLLNQLIEDLER